MQALLGESLSAKAAGWLATENTEQALLGDSHTWLPACDVGNLRDQPGLASILNRGSDCVMRGLG